MSAFNQEGNHRNLFRQTRVEGIRIEKHCGRKNEGAKGQGGVGGREGSAGGRREREGERKGENVHLYFKRSGKRK